MGALAPLIKWTMEDDLLLKNAVEAGASLESLAKGAVCFSRRYTIKELQDRWRALLCDLDTSIEASARLIEVEIELSVSNASKTNRVSSSKGKENPGKRKGDTVKNQYYAMRKRICSEPQSSADLGFLQPTPFDYANNDLGCEQHMAPHTSDAFNNCVSSKTQENYLGHYEHLSAESDHFQHVWPDVGIIDSVADVAHMDSVGDDFPDNDCIIQYTENIIPSVNRSEGGNTQEPFDDFAHNDMHQSEVVHINCANTCEGAHEIGPPETFPSKDMYGDDDIKTGKLPVFDHSIGHQGQRVPEFSHSPNQPGCSSAYPGHPLWGTIDVVSVQNISISDQGASAFHDGNNMKEMCDHQGESTLLDVDNLREIHDSHGAALLDADHITRTHSPGRHVSVLETELPDGIPNDALDGSKIIAENNYVDISSSYMNFTDDELLLINVDDKDIADRTSLNSLNSILLSSPSDVRQDDACNSSELGAMETVNACPTTQYGTCQGSSQHISGVDEPSSSLKAYDNAGSLEGIMVCVLNMEDPEIPCNDDVFPLAQFLSSSPFEMDCSPTEKPGSMFSSSNVLFTDEKTSIQPFASSMNTEFPNAGLVHPSDGFMTECKSIEGESRPGISRHAGIGLGDPNSCSRPLQSGSILAKKQETTVKSFGKHISFEAYLEKTIQMSDLANHCSLNIADNCQVVDIQDTHEVCLPYAEQTSAEITIADPEKNISHLDQADQLSDGESDVPSFSDIEAMILDMDLGPYDQDSCLFTKEVSRYQCAHTKKAIIKLEQGARSYMQRSISSHGAFAILYGRHLKYYIRSPKVSLGRATEGVKVDIDLGREGRTKKISRRQAVIKMDEDGSFFLTNTGKGSIFINSKEVPSEKRINLTSGCLIEIRGMRFIFEVNHNAVRHYLSSLQPINLEQKTEYDWIPDQAL